MGESNASIIRKAYEDFAQGNIPSVFAAFDAGIIWHVPGHGPLSGDYIGHDQIGVFYFRNRLHDWPAFGPNFHLLLSQGGCAIRKLRRAELPLRGLASLTSAP